METRPLPRRFFIAEIVAVATLASLIGLILLPILTPIDPLGFVDTQYTDGFDMKSFREIAKGDPASKALDLVGEPFTRQKLWNVQRRYWANHEITIVFHDDVVTAVADAKSTPTPGITKGMALCEVKGKLGFASRVEDVDYEYEYWSYSRSLGFGSYWQVYLEINVKSDKVENIRDSFYWD